MIIPTYNEESRIEKELGKLMEFSENNLSDFEIIVADDDSKDKTLEIANKLAKNANYIRTYKSNVRVGRGETINNVAKICKGETIIYLDADNATELKHIEELAGKIKEGYGIATGSRYLKKSKAKREMLRRVLSTGYNTLVKILFGSKIQDHQCGFKAFNKEVLLGIIPKIKSKHWFWDTELLVKAQRKGIKVSEIAVNWSEKKGSTLNPIFESIRMFSKILWLFWDIRIKGN